MKKGTLHLKLAKALYALAKKQNKAAEIFQQLGELADLILDEKLLMALEGMAAAGQSEQLEILKKSFPKSWAEELFNLLVLLISSRQIDLLPAVKTAYQKYYFVDEGINDFQVCSSRELSGEEQAEIKANLEKSAKAHVVFLVDKSLIGGIQIYQNGRLMDFSVKNQLEYLRRLLLGEHIV